MWFPPAMLAVFVTQRQQQPFCPCIDACLRVFVISCGPFFFSSSLNEQQVVPETIPPALSPSMSVYIYAPHADIDMQWPIDSSGSPGPPVFTGPRYGRYLLLSVSQPNQYRDRCAT